MLGGLKGRHIVVLIVSLGIVVEIPLVVSILDRGDAQPRAAATRQNNLGGAASSLPLHPFAGNFKADETKLADCSDETCYQQAYGNIAYRQGTKAAFALLEKQFGAGADPNCHRITHSIGAAALARNKGNVARTFAEGSSTCWSGYYHGVLERAFISVKSYDADSLGAKSRELCSDRKVQASSWLTYQCLHGLGHGLMITTGYRLPLTLKVCNRLATPWDATSCKGGVFMENILTSYGGQSPWVRDDDPLYPCDWVARADKYPCYQNAATRIIRVVGVDWETIAKTCARADKEFVTTCFGSYGQNASVIAHRRPTAILPTCAVTRPYHGERECIRYAAMDITGTFSSGRRAAPLCNGAAPEIRGGCYEAIGLMLRRLKETKTSQLRACRAISANPKYVARCINGTTLTANIPGLAQSATR